MTVAELIARLQNEDPEAPVHFAYPSGDYWRTTLAPEVRKVEELTVKLSAYHDKPALEDEDDEAEIVVVLS